MKADLFYELVQGVNPREKQQQAALLEKATTQSVISGNSEAQLSEIFIDPAVIKTSDVLHDLFIKVLALSFHLMIAMHEIEVTEYYRPKADPKKGIMSPTPIDPQTLKQVHPDDIPKGCELSDTRAKWIIDDLDQIYEEIVSQIMLPAIYQTEERLVHDVFIHKVAREHAEFLKSHQVRKMVFSQIVDRMFQQSQP